MGKAELVAELTVGDLAAALPAMSVLAIMRRVTVRGWQERIEFYVLLNDDQLEALERARTIGDRRPEIGERRLETGDLRLESGDWRLETGDRG